VRSVLDDYKAAIPAAVLSRLTNLTCLIIEGGVRGHSSDINATLGYLPALTRLADLDLDFYCSTFSYSYEFGVDEDPCRLTASALSGVAQLTRLVVSIESFEPRALAGKPQLQHLSLRCYEDGEDQAEGLFTWQLLSELRYLTQLTHLDLNNCCRWRADQVQPTPPLATYASLTASSGLQNLAFGGNTLPSAAWQYMCPPGWTLPQLRYLDIDGVREADGSPTLPDTSSLVSCCPGLQTLLTSMPCSSAQLTPLQRLTGLRTLSLSEGSFQHELEGVPALCELTGLQSLKLHFVGDADARMMQLTQLRQLTYLYIPIGGRSKQLCCDRQVGVGSGLALCRRACVWRPAALCSHIVR
jgi:hypothetical protein